MSRRNRVIAYFIGIFISVGLSAFGGGHFIERKPFRPHPWHPSWREPLIDRPKVPDTGQQLRPPIYWGTDHWLDPDWRPRTVVPIEIEPTKSPDEIDVQ